MALQLNDAYLDRPAIETVKHIQLYCYSLERCVDVVGPPKAQKTHGGLL
jgi:hypothetical protein